jgi:hypothetical protein
METFLVIHGIVELSYEGYMRIPSVSTVIALFGITMLCLLSLLERKDKSKLLILPFFRLVNAAFLAVTRSFIAPSLICFGVSVRNFLE